MVKQILLTLLFLILLARPSLGRSSHLIHLRWPDLYPPSLAWDPKADHFLLPSLRHPHLVSVSDAGVSSALLSDESLPPNSSFLAVSLDPRLRRLLVVVRSPTPPLSALAAYDLPTSRRLFLAPLDGLIPSPAAASHVAADYSGNAYVTDSANGAVYRVTERGEATVLSRSQAFLSGSGDGGLNGVVYNSKGYLLVTQSSTGKLFKVNADDGTARRVILNRDLTGAGAIATRRDGVVVVVSRQKLYFVKSDDSWGEGVVFDETALDEAGHASGVAVAAEGRVYVVYGHVGEGMMGSSGREEFSIVEVRSEVEGKDENVWIFVLLGLGLAYFLYWRFQMKQLVQNMDKKTS
ncbi:NHL domain-containing protein [Striga hermonthica]|uniref:NHL domain-containing protein n=1 Tax=Striga hermonthica TaxID=68872 RepID=A0A9N7RJJ9_STRHE|nr:NHL domain-containing protein [Striga hermonthica]